MMEERRNRRIRAPIASSSSEERRGRSRESMPMRPTRILSCAFTLFFPRAVNSERRAWAFVVS